MVILARKMVIPSDTDAARQAQEGLLAEACRCGFCEPAMFAIKLALEEGLINAIKHGNGFDKSKKVTLEYQVDPQQAVICITDEGKGFDPDAVPDPTADENLEKPCGRGIMLMRAYMDDVRYNERGNSVCLTKKNSPSR